MVDYKQILQEIGYSNINENSKELRAKPIYRNSDNNSVLRIKKSNGSFVDFSKNICGSFEELIQLSLGLTSVEEARTWLNDKFAYKKHKKEIQEEQITQIKTFDPSCLSRLQDSHWYWVARNIKEETVKIFTGGIAMKGKMAERYVFPIFDFQKNLVGFSGRDLSNLKTRPKWKHIGNKSNWVYPATICEKEITKLKEVIIVESIGDMLALYNVGIENVLVSFGLNIGGGIIKFLLKKDCKKIIIAFNNDVANNLAGNEAAEKEKEKLSIYFDPGQIEVRLPQKKDFGEMTKEEILDWKKT